MEEFTADIAFDGFVDMPEFYGEGRASYRLAMVKRREDFLVRGRSTRQRGDVRAVAVADGADAPRVRCRVT